LTLADLVMGEALLASRLLDPNIQTANGRLALFMVEDEVLMALPAQDLMSTISVLKPGDRVDVLFSLPMPTQRTEGAESGGDEEQSTFALLQNIAIAAMVGGQTGQEAIAAIPGQEAAAQPAAPPRALLLTLPPQDALVLKYMIDAGGTLDLVLRAPGVERPFDIDPVDLDYLIDRYDLPIQVGR
jgi:Flp pilus assembly protein CpaB